MLLSERKILKTFVDWYRKFSTPCVSVFGRFCVLINYMGGGGLEEDWGGLEKDWRRIGEGSEKDWRRIGDGPPMPSCFVIREKIY